MLVEGNQNYKAKSRFMSDFSLSHTILSGVFHHFGKADFQASLLSFILTESQ